MTLIEHNGFPSLLIRFDEHWAPTIFLNGASDTETAKLQQIADMILHALEHSDDTKTNQ